MKQVRMMREREVLIGWVEDRAAKIGALVEVIGQGMFRVIEVFGFRQDGDAVRELEKRSRRQFTAYRSYRASNGA